MKRILVFLAVLMAAGSAYGMVTYQDIYPSSRPSDAVMGRWGSNASCVVIGPNFVITTRHQGGGVGTAVVVAGATYRVSEVIDSAYDLRLARLVRLDGSPADLTTFVPVYSGSSSSATSSATVIGGYGKGRGSDLVTNGVTYGYAWSGSSNTTLRWGTNTIDTVYGSYLYADFDAFGISGSTAYEAAIAEWDSGGGWFIMDSLTGRWSVVGLSAGTEHGGASWFRNATNPSKLDPDSMYAVNLIRSADWITDTVTPEPATLVLLLGGSLAMFVRRKHPQTARMK